MPVFSTNLYFLGLKPITQLGFLENIIYRKQLKVLVWEEDDTHLGRSVPMVVPFSMELSIAPIPLIICGFLTMPFSKAIQKFQS
ncbi:hypothetical protein DVH24_027512 [Malus domestica]|uniref:Uncharacterized protein n=1 Tax=Malus domestica TaxID=3750 RepID=A0A498HD46_MALDO|nr:hypothetical protein DVH24_027512 [Malus domestica]